MANPQNPAGNDPRKQQNQQNPSPLNPGGASQPDNRQQSQQGGPHQRPGGQSQDPQQANPQQSQEGGERGQQFRN